MKVFFYLLIGLFTATSFAQSLTGTQLLEKAIRYHDPNSKWGTFNGELHIAMDMPKRPVRKSIVTINLPEEYFNITTTQDTVITVRELNKGICTAPLDKVNDAEFCKRSKMFKNYYTYLYGLPMKLKDPGTNIDPVVTKKIFKGKEYLVLRVTYDEAVGSDIWQFYFNPETYAMEVYQFFKGTDETTGEYILLSGEIEIDGMKIPKDRAWYYNKDDGYLATDRLIKG